MEAKFVYGLVFMMSAMASIFIYLVMAWIKKSRLQTEKLKEIENRQQELMLKATIEGQETERRRVANDLHDGVGPLLSALKLQINSSIPDNDKKSINSTLKETVKSIKDISARMSPSVLEELGLNESIRSIATRFRSITRINLNLEWDDSIESILEEAYSIHIYRIIQEALNNVLKHACATNVKIYSVCELSYVLISIIDDGVGFKMVKDESKNGMGLNSMKARCKLMNAKFNIVSSADGTVISFRINHKS